MAKTKIPPRDAWTTGNYNRAKGILCEKSPYAKDGGQTIGRDPRQIFSKEFTEAGIATDVRILDVIRAKCLDCCAEQADEVRKCTAVACPNWPYRMGTNPFRTVNLTVEAREKLAEKMRALQKSKKVE